jgi:transcriptional regulator with XRE-family HTH domain
MLGQNIRYLRHQKQISQQELAEMLSVPRSSVSDYERGHTEPDIERLIKLSEIFNVNLDDLIRTNVSHQELEIIKNPDFRVLAISVDAHNASNIELVQTKAAAGYLESFADPEYIRDLPKISFPNMPQGTYRGFEIEGDSMLPVEPGTIVICSYVEKLEDLKKNKTYVIIGKTQGVVYKRVRPDFAHELLTLISDNDSYLPYTIAFDEVAEIWQYYAHLSFSDVKFSFEHMLEEKLQDLQRKMNEVHQKVVG